MSAPTTPSPTPSAPRPMAPPPKPKPKKSNLTAILSAVSVLFAGTSGYLYTQLKGKTSELGTATDGLLKIAQAAGSGALKAEDLVNPEAVSAAIETLNGEVGTIVTERQAARSEVDRQRVQISDMESKAQAAELKLANTQSQLSEARAEFEKATAEVQDLTKKAEDLQKQHGEELAGLNAKITELQAALAAALPADAATEVVTSEEVALAPGEVSPIQTKEIAEGDSKLFKSATYDSSKQTLTLVGLNDEKLVYRNVPAQIFDGMSAAPVVDVFYRFKVLEQFQSTPNDLEFISAIND